MQKEQGRLILRIVQLRSKTPWINFCYQDHSCYFSGHMYVIKKSKVHFEFNIVWVLAIIVYLFICFSSIKMMYFSTLHILKENGIYKIFPLNYKNKEEKTSYNFDAIYKPQTISEIS